MYQRGDVRMLHASRHTRPVDVELADDDWPSLPRSNTYLLMKCVSRSALKNLCRKSERSQITELWQILQNWMAGYVVILFEFSARSSVLCFVSTRQMYECYMPRVTRDLLTSNWQMMIGRVSYEAINICGKMQLAFGSEALCRKSEWSQLTDP